MFSNFKISILSKNGNFSTKVGSLDKREREREREREKERERDCFRSKLTQLILIRSFLNLLVTGTCLISCRTPTAELPALERLRIPYVLADGVTTLSWMF